MYFVTVICGYFISPVYDRTDASEILYVVLDPVLKYVPLTV